MSSNLKITICGDICPTKDTLNSFLSNEKSQLFSNEILKQFETSDLVIGNLEYVLTDDPKPIKKAGPILHAPKKSVEVLKNAGFDVLLLANNHIKDCGEEGVKSTLETCENYNLKTLGAAQNINAAKEPLIQHINDQKIGFIVFAEQEFNCASDSEYGANYFDPLTDLDLIEETKKKVDILIVIYHGGIEYYRYPSPMLQKKCRRFVDKGADLVLCQHSHCIGTDEDYKDSKILYGQGNTVFGYREKNSSWNQGLIVELEIKNNKKNIKYLPITAHPNGGIKFLENKKATEVLNNLKMESIKILDKTFINNSWEAFVTEKSKMYIPYLLGFNRFFIHLNRFTLNKFTKLFYSNNKLKTSHNIIRCEAHNEVIQSILKKW